MLFSTGATYLSGILIDRINHSKLTQQQMSIRKKSVVAICLCVNLGILFFFKYYNFAIDLVQDVFLLANIELNVPQIDVLLPVGISFYTFQALSYTMDIYRGDIYAEKNFFRYALFVSFFPQLVAGPIERSKHLLRQLAVTHKFNYDKARDGVLLMLWGFFLKIVIADRIAIFVDTVYGDIATYTGWYLIVATMLFAVQIYCDFAGYSVIAIGTAKILGIDLMENFDAPYLSTSVATFWRKWHISLTSWFKDYLYIPLGGSRKGVFRKYLNKLIVFLVSGLWHGANLTFVIWGALNGIYQIIGEILEPIRIRFYKLFKLNRKSLGQQLVSIAITFVLIDFAWIFFRANDLNHAFSIIQSIANATNIHILFDGSLYTCGLDEKNLTLALLGIVILIFADICKHNGIVIRSIIQKQDSWFRCVFIALATLLILLFGMWGPAFDQANFIYFQF